MTENGCLEDKRAIRFRTSVRQADFLIRPLSSDIRHLSHVVEQRKWTSTNESVQANRAISTGKLNALPRLHTRPINVVVYHGSQGRTRFEVGFPLRCFQRLSRPHIATRPCRWRDNRCTRGASIPVLSY